MATPPPRPPSRSGRGTGKPSTSLPRRPRSPTSCGRGGWVGSPGRSWKLLSLLGPAAERAREWGGGGGVGAGECEAEPRFRPMGFDRSGSQSGPRPEKGQSLTSWWVAMLGRWAGTSEGMVGGAVILTRSDGAMTSCWSSIERGTGQSTEAIIGNRLRNRLLRRSHRLQHPLRAKRQRPDPVQDRRSP